MAGIGVASTGPRLRVGRVGITLEPSFLVISAGIGLLSGTLEGLVAWVLAVFVSVLVHELGPAAFLAMDPTPRSGSTPWVGSRAGGSRVTLAERDRQPGGSAGGDPARPAGVGDQGLDHRVRPASPSCSSTTPVWAPASVGRCSTCSPSSTSTGARSPLLAGVQLSGIGPRSSLPALPRDRRRRRVVALALRQPFPGAPCVLPRFPSSYSPALTAATAGWPKEEADDVHRAIDDGRLAEATARMPIVRRPTRVLGPVRRDIAELPVWIPFAGAIERGRSRIGDAPHGHAALFRRATLAAVADRRDVAIDLAAQATGTDPNVAFEPALAWRSPTPEPFPAWSRRWRRPAPASTAASRRSSACSRTSHHERRYAEAMAVGRRAPGAG